jgi:hypothetical protein
VKKETDVCDAAKFRVHQGPRTGRGHSPADAGTAPSRAGRLDHPLERLNASEKAPDAAKKYRRARTGPHPRRKDFSADRTSRPKGGDEAPPDVPTDRSGEQPCFPVAGCHRHATRITHSSRSSFLTRLEAFGVRNMRFSSFSSTVNGQLCHPRGAVGRTLRFCLVQFEQ